MHPPVLPFTHDTAAQKVHGAEDAWNFRDPDRVAQPCTEDTLQQRIARINDPSARA